MFDTTAMNSIDRERTWRFLQRHQIDITNVRPVGLVSQPLTIRDGLSPQVRYKVHLTEFVRDEKGNLVVDYAQNEAVTRPLVIEVAEKPPSCMTPGMVF